MNDKVVKFIFFGSSRFSKIVLEELGQVGLKPIFKVTSARSELNVAELKALKADVLVVASFGKIIPREILDLPRLGALNVHPSLLPRLRGPSPIQNTILLDEEPGVTIIKMDEEVDHGPILGQEKVEIKPWPDNYEVVEEKLARAGGKLLIKVLPEWIEGKRQELPQDEKLATYTKLLEKEDGLLDPSLGPEKKLRKVLAYSTWPGAYFTYERQDGKVIRVLVKDAEVIEGVFFPTKVVPAGKKEMSWPDFLRGNSKS